MVAQALDASGFSMAVPLRMPVTLAAEASPDNATSGRGLHFEARETTNLGEGEYGVVAHGGVANDQHHVICSTSTAMHTVDLSHRDVLRFEVAKNVVSHYFARDVPHDRANLFLLCECKGVEGDTPGYEEAMEFPKIGRGRDRDLDGRLDGAGIRVFDMAVITRRVNFHPLCLVVN